MPGTFTAPYPYCLHCKVQQGSSYSGYPLHPDCQPFMDPAARSCCMAPVESLEWMLKQQTAPQETAALILEPVLGEGGFLTPPPGMMAALRQLCDQHGILLISDEVRCCWGAVLADVLACRSARCTVLAVLVVISSLNS